MIIDYWIEIAVAFGLAITFLLDSSAALGMTVKVIGEYS